MSSPAPLPPEWSASSRPAGPALLAVLLGSVGVGPLLIYGLSAISDRVITDLGISEAQFGLLATACFASAAVSTGALARFADRRSDMALMAFIFITGALALMTASIPAGFAVLLAAAVLSGVAQSFPNGVTNRIIVERVPASRRLGWVGVKQSGVQVAQLVSSVTFPLLAVYLGWRGAALMIACVPLVLLLVCSMVLRRTPRLNVTAPSPVVPTPSSSATNDDADDAGPAARSESSPAPSSPAPTRPPVLWALAAFGMLNGIAMQAANVYMPLFAVRELGFSLVMGGMAAAVAGLVGVAARVGWARVMARGASGPLLMVSLSCTALASSAAFLAAHLLGAPALLWAAVVLHGASSLGVSVVLMGSVMRLMPAASIASASGLVTSGMFLGFALGPVGMGLLVTLPNGSSFGGFLAGWVTVGAVYVLCVVLAAALMWRTRRLRS